MSNGSCAKDATEFLEIWTNRYSPMWKPLRPSDKGIRNALYFKVDESEKSKGVPSLAAW